MASSYGTDEFSQKRHQEYYPLHDLPPALAGASTNDHYDSTLYSEGDIAECRGAQNAPNLKESVPAAYNPSTSSIQKLLPTEGMSDLPGRPFQFSLKEWHWEIGACIVSLGCFATAVGVLASYDNKSLTSWNFVFGITLNTLIAILSTLSRTTLLVPVTSCISQLKWTHLIAAPRPLREVQVFDDASRGPWGSLELIWKLHIRTKLATWGSVITILTLAMGPFTQQLLSYPSRSVISGNAVYYASHVYDSAWGESRWLRTGEGFISQLPEDCPQTLTWTNVALLALTMGPKMQGAILNGLFNLSSPVQFTCTTGNCRWDEFSTLAVTSSCQNVTSQTVVRCERSISKLETDFVCNYTTPAGFFIKASSRQNVVNSGSITSFNSTAFDLLSDDPHHFRTELINSTLAKIALANLQGNFNVSNPDILECDMRLCARVISNLTVTNGTFDTGSFDDIELEGVPSQWDKDQQAGVGGFLRDYYTFNITGDHPTFPGNHSFSIHTIDIEDVKSFLYDIFTSTYTGSSVSPYYWPLMNSSDHTKTVAAISQSMSYAMAQAPSGETLEGRAFITELYIQVQWPWIILPLAEVVMSIGLLVCTLGYTRHKGVPAWKSSGIVPLLTVMMGWDNSELRATSARDIGKRSQVMRGQLVTNHGDIQAFYRTD